MSKDLLIRQIQEQDVDQVVALYHKAYGDDFPFKDFYDSYWVKKGVFSDDMLWNVAEDNGKIVGSATVITNVGDHSDLIGELVD